MQHSFRHRGSSVLHRPVESAIQNGLANDQFEFLSALAAGLPESNIAAVIKGLDETEAATLVSDILQRLAPEIGVKFAHPNLLRQLDLPIYEPQDTKSDIQEFTEEANHDVNGAAG